MRFSVDPWDPAYGTSLDTELGASTAEVDVDVELPAGRWRPLAPPPGVLPPAVVRFVDGVRRVDAQVWVDEPDGSASPALCASYAAGVVCCCAADGAHLIDARVQRGLFTTAAAGADIVTAAGTYAATHTAALPDKPPMQTLSLALQRSLAATELLSALGARDGHGVGPDELTVVDGPLPRQPLPCAIGFIKSHRDTYLPTALGGIVATLGDGERTPVFRLSRSLGRPPIATTLRVTLPLVSRGLLAGGGLVFLTTMKELPATLLLRPTGFETLAVRIWSTTSEGFYTRASFAALVLIAVSAVPLHLLIARDLNA